MIEKMAFYRSKQVRGLLQRFCSILLICSFASLIVVAALYYVDPVRFRRFFFQPVREVLFFQRELGIISKWDKVKKIRIPFDTTITIPKNAKDDLKIAASLKIPQEQGRLPAVLLLHGSSPFGRKNALIHLLAYRLFNTGWIVLSPDARGFGESNDPLDIDNPSSWNVENDVRRCIDYLFKQPKTDTNKIFVIGHSMGAGHALEGSLDDPRVRALILIGPPRYMGRFEASLWKRSRFSADREISKPIKKEITELRILKTDISNYAKGPLKIFGHKPLLLFDGDFEGDENLSFLATVASEISPPFIYHTLKDTGHYCGVYNLFGSESIYYRPDLFDPFWELLMNYFRMVVDEKKL